MTAEREAVGASASRLQPVLQRYRDILEAARREVQQDISAYPPPITGCDAQFNALTERRTALSNEWHALGQCQDTNDLRDLLMLSGALDTAHRDELLARLER